MNEITRVGVDLAKRVIQVHAIDATGRVVAAKALPADKFAAWCVQLPAGCLVAMEACGGAHHWARKLRGYGLDARLIAGHFVTPYRMAGKGGKNDAADAAAICEAAGRPHMRFVPVKTPAQQALLAIHRLREGYKEDRTACINRIRGLLTEFGIVFAQSPDALRRGLADVLEDASNELPGIARLALQEARLHWIELECHIASCDERIAAHVRSDAQAKAAAQLAGIGPCVPGGISSHTDARDRALYVRGLQLVPAGRSLALHVEAGRRHWQGGRASLSRGLLGLHRLGGPLRFPGVHGAPEAGLQPEWPGRHLYAAARAQWPRLA